MYIYFYVYIYKYVRYNIQIQKCKICYCSIIFNILNVTIYIYIFHVENTYNAFLKIYTIYKICYIYMYSQHSIYSICVYDAINLMYI